MGGRVPAQWDDQLERIRKQLPPAPEGLLAFYVKWIPWVAIVLGAISLVLLIVGGLFVAVLTPFMAASGTSGVAAGLGLIVGIVLGLVYSILAIVGGWRMRSMKLNGWWLLAAGLVISFISDVISLSILGIVIVLGIAYLHLQVKSRYS
jgi:hypothetical protein